jgi:hypothetical protein
MKLSSRRFLALLLILIAAFLYHRYRTASGVLASYGVYFDDDATPFASPNLNEVKFWFDGAVGRLPGPEITGDRLYVERPYRSEDGHLEFAVQSDVYRSQRVRIQLLMPPERDSAFRVVEVDIHSHRVRYTPQGLHGSP